LKMLAGHPGLVRLIDIVRYSRVPGGDKDFLVWNKCDMNSSKLLLRVQTHGRGEELERIPSNTIHLIHSSHWRLAQHDPGRPLLARSQRNQPRASISPRGTKAHASMELANGAR